MLRTVLELMAEAIDTKVASDVASRNTLTKLQTSLLKLMHDIATAERGGGDEETILDETIAPRHDVDMTLHSQAGAEEDETELEPDEDEVTMQLRRELESTRLENPDAESTRLDVDDSVQEYDFSGMADDKDIQELLDSIVDEDDEDLID